MSRMAMMDGRAMPNAPTMPPPYATQLVADVTGDVDGEDARRGLRHHHDIHELLTAQPVVLVYILALHDGYHGLAAA